MSPRSPRARRGATRVVVATLLVLGVVALAVVLATAGRPDGDPRGPAPTLRRNTASTELDPALVEPAAEADEREVAPVAPSPEATATSPFGRAPLPYRHVRLRWHLVEAGRQLGPDDLAALELDGTSVSVRARSLVTGGGPEVGRPTPWAAEGTLELNGEAPVELQLLVRGLVVDEVPSLGSRDDHDMERNGAAELDVALELPLAALRDAWSRLVVRPADPARRIVRLDVEDADGRRRTRRPRPASGEERLHVPAGRQLLDALLDDGGVAHADLVLRGGSEQVVVLEPEPPGTLELALDAPDELPPRAEVLVYPRDARLAHVLAEDWTVFGFPTFALTPGRAERFNTPPTPAGTYDVVLRSAAGLGDETVLPLAAVDVVPGERTRVDLDLGLERLVAQALVRVDGVGAADVVVRSVEGAVVLVERLSLGTPLRLPLGSYLVEARRCAPDALELGTHARDVATGALDVTMAGTELELVFEEVAW